MLYWQVIYILLCDKMFSNKLNMKGHFLLFEITLLMLYILYSITLLLQPIYGLVIVVHTTWLLMAITTNWSIIPLYSVEYLFLPFIFTGDFIYVDNQICQIPLRVSFLVRFIVLYIYYDPPCILFPMQNNNIVNKQQFINYSSSQEKNVSLSVSPDCEIFLNVTTLAFLTLIGG